MNAPRTAAIVLAVTALAISRTAFALIEDPEGPNLLVVFGLAAILYAPALAISRYVPRMRLFVGIIMEAALALLLYFFFA